MYKPTPNCSTRGNRPKVSALLPKPYQRWTTISLLHDSNDVAPFLGQRNRERWSTYEMRVALQQRTLPATLLLHPTQPGHGAPCFPPHCHSSLSNSPLNLSLSRALSLASSTPQELLLLSRTFLIKKAFSRRLQRIAPSCNPQLATLRKPKTPSLHWAPDYFTFPIANLNQRSLCFGRWQCEQEYNSSPCPYGRESVWTRLGFRPFR